jgi:hypothetical protein
MYGFSGKFASFSPFHVAVSLKMSVPPFDFFGEGGTLATQTLMGS